MPQDTLARFLALAGSISQFDRKDAMALLRDATPDLTPAQRSKLLEATAAIVTPAHLRGPAFPVKS